MISLGIGVGPTQSKQFSLLERLSSYPNLTFFKDFYLSPGEATAAMLNAVFAGGSKTATFTASRGASNPATYIDASGVIQLVTNSNVGRITSGFYDSTGFVSRPGLIVEGASTNLLVRTDGTSWTGWAISSGTGMTGWTATNPTASSISGIASSTTQRIQYTAIPGDSAETLQLVSANTAAASFVNGQTGTTSIWLRSTNGLSGITVTLQFNVRDSSGTLLESWGTTITSSITTSWKRFQVTGTTAQATADRISVKVYLDSIDNGDSFDIECWGPQFEVLPFASTFIPTTTAALTRNAERLDYETASNRTGTTESAFIKNTLFFNPSTELTTFAYLLDNPTKRRILQFQSNGTMRFFPNITDSAAVLVTTSVVNVAKNTSSVYSAVCAATGDPNANVYLNGVSIGSTNSDFTANAFSGLFNIHRIYTGDNNTSYGIIQSIAFFSDAKSSANVLAISNLMAAG